MSQFIKGFGYDFVTNELFKMITELIDCVMNGRMPVKLGLELKNSLPLSISKGGLFPQITSGLTSLLNQIALQSLDTKKMEEFRKQFEHPHEVALLLRQIEKQSAVTRCNQLKNLSLVACNLADPKLPGYPGKKLQKLVRGFQEMKPWDKVNLLKDKKIDDLAEDTGIYTGETNGALLLEYLQNDQHLILTWSKAGFKPLTGKEKWLKLAAKQKKITEADLSAAGVEFAVDLFHFLTFSPITKNQEPQLYLTVFKVGSW